MSEQNWRAQEGVEIDVGHDKMVRINVDGICALRIRCEVGVPVIVTIPSIEFEKKIITQKVGGPVVVGVE